MKPSELHETEVKLRVREMEAHPFVVRHRTECRTRMDTPRACVESLNDPA